jgi:hypothetical protein
MPVRQALPHIIRSVQMGRRRTALNWSGRPLIVGDHSVVSIDCLARHASSYIERADFIRDDLPATLV